MVQAGADEVIGTDVVLPGSQQLAPVVFGVLLAIGVALFLLGLIVRVTRSRRRPEGAPLGRPWLLGAIAVFCVVALAATWWTFPPAFRSPEFPPIGRLFPDDVLFYRDASDLPVAARSDAWVSSLGGAELVAGFGGEPYDGIVFGIPFNPVDESTPRTSVRFRSSSQGNFTGPYPIADPAYIESMPTYGIDNHYVALDRSTNQMWELLGTVVWFGRWEADSGALWDLASSEFDDYEGTTSSGLPLLAGVVGYDEFVAGSVDHVMLAGAPPEMISSGEPLWPARDSDGRSVGAAAIPMGAWLRLRDDVDLSELGPQATVIAEGLQRYGMILSDSAGNFGVRGTPDGRWDRSDLRTMRTLTADDFEVVDPSAIMIGPHTMAVRPTGD